MTNLVEVSLKLGLGRADFNNRGFTCDSKGVARLIVAGDPPNECEREEVMTQSLGTKGPKILLYSNHSSVRTEVRVAVGDTVADQPVEWLEVATYEALWEIAQKGNFDLFILDGEAHKVGGMGISRELKESLYECPPVLLLTGRAQDAWLASWSLADDAVPRPLDVFALQAAVERLVTEPSSAVVER